jgi:galactosylceramidase
MAEARRRNGGIILDSLAWGAPAWIGNGTYYSQDMADYIADWLVGVKSTYGFEVAYTGIWNERMYDIPWIKRLRQTLDARGLESVQIVGADQCVKQWHIAEDLAKDPDLAKAVAVVGEHYPGYRTTDAARACGKRLWAAEDGPWRGDWSGACHLARVYNRNFIQGGMTKTVVWSLVTSYADNLPLPGSGLMRANTPWSGAYEIQPALWATAHTTQVAEPGWRYLTGEACRLIPGGSVVTLLSPDGRDLSLIAESSETDESTTLEVTLPPSFVGRTFHPWLSTATAWFQPQPDLTAVEGRLRVTMPPRAILSLTTTTGQRQRVPISPAAKPFPAQWQDDFTATPEGHLGRGWSDQGGVFTVAADAGNHVLRQTVGRKGIVWQKTPDPVTLLGDPAMEDQTIQVRARLDADTPDVLPGTPHYLAVFTRIGYLQQDDQPSPGYALRVHADGRWEVLDTGTVLRTGQGTPLGTTWHTLRLAVTGDRLSAHLNGRLLTSLTTARHAFGTVGLGSGYHPALFDDLEVRTEVPVDLAKGCTATASSAWDGGFGPERAVDGIAAHSGHDTGWRSQPTRWNSGKDVQPEEWLLLDFGTNVSWDTLRLIPAFDRQQVVEVQVPDGDGWRTLTTSGVLGADPVTLTVAPVATTRMRILGRGLKEALSFVSVQVFRR